jgi:SRSO17 transposase
MGDTITAFHSQYADLFGRREARWHSEQYLRGLLARADSRRSAATIAGVDGATPRALQRFLSSSGWSVGPLIAAIQRDLGALLSAPDGVFVLGEIGFRKQGTKSVGVGRQPCGPLADVANCQVGVFLAYASERGQALVDARLYLPHEWIDDAERRRAAGIPPEIGYRTREELGLEMLGLARRRGSLTGEWLASDGRYAQSVALRHALDAEGLRYVLEVPRTTPIYSAPHAAAVFATPAVARPPDRCPVIGSLIATGWQESTLPTPKGTSSTYRFAVRRVQDSKEGDPGVDRWLVVRRDMAGGDPRYYLSNAAPDTPLATVAHVAGLREATAPLFRDGRGETGLGEYEVRGWQGWHRHVTLALLAGTYLAYARASA